MIRIEDEFYKMAYELHQNNLVVDGHLDLAAEVYGRYNCNEREVIKNHYLDNFKKAGISFVLSSVFIESEDLPYKGADMTLKQISALIKDIETVKDDVMLVKSKKDLQTAISQNKIGIILYIEGLDIITDDPLILYGLHAMGVMGASLTWSRRNYLAQGCCKASELVDIKGGLSELGIETVKTLEELNMFIDVSHLNDDGFLDLKKVVTKPFLATHSNSREVHMNYRNLTNEQIRNLVKLGGVMGLNAYGEIVGANPLNDPIPKMCEHVKYIVDTFGDDYIGYGLDLCDSYNESTKRLQFKVERGDCLRNHTELVDVTAELLRQGINEDSIKKIIGGNFVRYFTKVFD